MCGIVTIAGPPHNSRATERFAETVAMSLKHRGPNGIRAFAAPKYGLAMAHARLSVIDLDGGWQPIVDENSNALCFNGEIYNYRELRRELEHLGRKFKTKSDSEVLFNALLQWGSKAVGRLRGMFAFTFFNSATNELILARDQIGIKPLYFTIEDECIFIASELRTVAMHRREKPEVNRKALVQYVAIGYALSPDTLLKDVYQLPHATIGVWKDRQLRTERYFDPADYVVSREKSSSSVNSQDEYLEELDSLLADAVRSQLVSDVPIGVFLSGGIDSSLVAHYACSAHERPLTAFTADFSDREFSELGASQIAVKKLGLRQTVIKVEPSDLIDQISHIPWSSDAPIFDGSFVPSYLLCRETSRNVRVALSGDGGDELFLGYPTYIADRLAQRLRPFSLVTKPLLSSLGRALPSRFGKLSLDYKIRAFAQNFDRPTSQAHCGWRELVSLDLLETIFPLEDHDLIAQVHPRHEFARIAEKVANTDLLTGLSYVDLETWLVNDILVKSDRASMAHGLEVRVPLLDVAVVKFAFSLPDRVKMPGRDTKVLLKSLVRKHLSNELASLNKKGFSAPISQWLIQVLSDEIANLPRGLQTKFGLQAVAIQKMADAHRSHQFDYGYILWALFTLDRWFDGVSRAHASMNGAAA